jgi:DNA modification methylase
MTPYYDNAGITIFNTDCRTLVLPEKPALVLTDPPYGDDHNTDYSTQFSGGTLRRDGSEKPRYRHAAIEGDKEDFDPSHLLALSTETILWGMNRYSNKLPTGSLLVWDKRTPFGNKGVMSDAEVAWWSRGRGVYIFAHTWDGFNRASERQTNYHPTQKPVALMRWCLVRAKLAPGALVYDPYMGSGPIAKACKQLGYRYIGCELVENYCETTALGLQQEVMELFV